MNSELEAVFRMLDDAVEQAKSIRIEVDDEISVQSSSPRRCRETSQVQTKTGCHGWTRRFGITISTRSSFDRVWIRSFRLPAPCTSVPFAMC